LLFLFVVVVTLTVTAAVAGPVCHGDGAALRFAAIIVVVDLIYSGSESKQKLETGQTIIAGLRWKQKW
jgi:hypothetical protein